jgi:hypothetical protein
MRTLAPLLVVGSLAVFFGQPGRVQAGSDPMETLRREVEALKEGQRAIYKELQEIKALLRPRPAPQPMEPVDVVVSIQDAPFKGQQAARLTLVDFSDYQ